MSHYAQIDENNIVVNVIRAEEDFINSGAVGDPTKWIQTSYNTRNGVHELGKEPLRKNFAGIGSIYHPDGDFFSPAKPHNTAVLNLETGTWHDPEPHPDTRGTSDQYRWDSDSQSYVLI
jgi:hypothetical protein